VGGWKVGAPNNETQPNAAPLPNVCLHPNGAPLGTPAAALRACCYSRDAERGLLRIVDEGVARGPRGWYAVRRYE
jgi:hypothetical protein